MRRCRTLPVMPPKACWSLCQNAMTGIRQTRGIVDALKADKKDPSGPYVWITYAAVQSLATALERTGSDEPLALVKDLKANGANTVIGPLNWDEKGDLKGFDFGVFQWHADGSSTAAK